MNEYEQIQFFTGYSRKLSSLSETIGSGDLKSFSENAINFNRSTVTKSFLQNEAMDHLPMAGNRNLSSAQKGDKMNRGAVIHF